MAPPGVLTAAGLLPLGSPLGDEEQRLAPPAGVAAHASALAALGASLGVSWDCFALGETAAAVARCVAAHPGGGHAGGADRVAALLLLDRGCDLATPALPARDSLLLALDQLPAGHRRSGCDGCDALTDALGMPRLAALGGGAARPPSARASWMLCLAGARVTAQWRAASSCWRRCAAEPASSHTLCLDGFI